MKKIRIGIMGFGRIGRNLFRLVSENDQIDVVAISDIAPPKAMEYLLQFDTVHGRFGDLITSSDDSLFVRGKRVHYIQGRSPRDVPWKEFGVDTVIEASTKYRTRAELEGHLENGAQHVILTSPPAQDSDVDSLIIRGVNDEMLKITDRIISTSSVSANCMALILKVFHEAFGVERAFMNSVHAYTNDQRLADVPHTDLRRSRAAAENIIPTSTFAPQAVGKVIPELKGKLAGLAMNVPVPDGSNLDLVMETREPVDIITIQQVVKTASESARYRGLLSYVEAPIVSSDVIGDSHSAIFDATATQVMGKHLAKTLTWFDNGWGYAKRVMEIVERIASEEGAS